MHLCLVDVTSGWPGALGFSCWYCGALVVGFNVELVTYNCCNNFRYYEFELSILLLVYMV